MRANLRTVPLVQLLELIVSESDRDAINELHQNRTIFLYSGTRDVLSRYLYKLKEHASQDGWGSFSEEAYDITLNKFLSTSNVDCRNYFSAVLKGHNQRPCRSVLDSEMQIASILQRSVHRHFHLSLRTAKRNGHMTRFAWSTSTGVKHLKMPRTLSGSERRGWLERYASPDSSQDEVQQLIYDQFGLTGFVELTESIHDTDYPYVLSEGLENDIAEIVSREKADRIYEQRAAVSSLGEEKLKSLIKTVFKAILEGDESDGSIAKRFDLSKATFSRFCGRSWSTNIPDLWKNLASIIASHPAFREYAKTTRYWEKIQNSNK